MDKLQWFKFSYADWRMGKIQRCPELTQARFLNLCCLYWSKESNLSIEDAEIEIDKEHLDILISKKIVEVEDEYINIKFLDEQLLGILETSKEKKQSGKLGNLKRWHKELYDKVVKNELSISEAYVIVKQSHTDSTPIAPQSQSIADKRREEEIREDKKRKEQRFDIFWELYPKKVAKEKCKSKFMKLPESDIEKIKKTIKTFIAYKPFDEYTHPNPLTYLNQKRWEDVIVAKETEKTKQQIYEEQLAEVFKNKNQ